MTALALGNDHFPAMQTRGPPAQAGGYAPHAPQGSERGYAGDRYGFDPQGADRGHEFSGHYGEYDGGYGGFYARAWGEHPDASNYDEASVGGSIYTQSDMNSAASTSRERYSISSVLTQY